MLRFPRRNRGLIVCFGIAVGLLGLVPRVAAYNTRLKELALALKLDRV